MSAERALGAKLREAIGQRSTSGDRLAFGYFLVARAALAAAGVLLLVAPPVDAGFYQPRVLALTHLMVLGWITATILAVFYGPAPRFFGGRSANNVVDYSALILDPTAESVQDYVVFTYDDFQAGQPTGPYVPPPNHITSIREERFKLAKYYDPDGNEPEQWEMYDLAEDPLETVNIAHWDFSRTAEQEQALQRLTAKLIEVEATRLHGDEVANRAGQRR